MPYTNAAFNFRVDENSEYDGENDNNLYSAKLAPMTRFEEIRRSKIAASDTNFTVLLNLP